VRQRTRIFIAVAILLVLVAAVVGVEALRRSAGGSTQGTEDMPTAMPGGVPIYLDGQFMGAFGPPDLEALEMVSFVEAEEGKTEEGWLLRDVLLLHIKERALQPDTIVVVSSSSRDKSAQLIWAEVDDPANWVMFDLSGRGTLKLVSVLEKLDIRDEWVQDVDLIELTSP
jgi:hypothetical protein